MLIILASTLLVFVLLLLEFKLLTLRLERIFCASQYWLRLLPPSCNPKIVTLASSILPVSRKVTMTTSHLCATVPLLGCT